MKKPLFIFHPITIFVGSIIAVCLSYVLYLRWYIKIIGNIDDLALKFGVDQKLVAVNQILRIKQPIQKN